MTPISFYQQSINPYVFQSGSFPGAARTPINGQSINTADNGQQFSNAAGIQQNGAEKATEYQSIGPKQESRLAENKSILGKRVENEECQTCKSRKYKDGSNDPGVSFKTATSLSPEEAATAVRSHENEHVVREQAKAARENREVVSQSVTYHTAICPECGRPYISGGTTRTVTRAASEATNPLAQKFQAGLNEEIKGKLFDMTA